MKLYSFNQHLFMLMCMTLSVTSESYYSINAPGVLKSNRKYLVVATLHEANHSCSIRVGIDGPSFKEFKDVNLQPFESQIIEFFPKQLNEGKYFLKTEGISGLGFKNESELNEVIDEGPKIYIQTDKAIYKPQDLVRFRILILDEHTRPLHIKDPIHVEILDADENRVKIFKNISLINDVFTGKLGLSKYPVLGTWKIRVFIGGTYNYSNYKTIRIINYILPKFSVYIKAPSNVVLEDGNLKVVMYGKYTFDKYVEGNATIELWTADTSSLLQTKNIDVQNLGFTDFDIKNIKGINEIKAVKLKAQLSEKYTGNTQVQEEYINIRHQRYNLIIPYNEIEFEDNKPYSLKVFVKYWTGAPVLDHKTPVTMKHGDKVYESFLDDTGSATFEFEHEPNANHKFQFKDSKAEFPNIYTHPSLMLNNREFYCRLKLVDAKLKIGKPVLLEVSSIVNIPYLMYIIMGHASLVRQDYIKLPPNQKSYTIKIMPSIEMVPVSFIYVYYIHKGNLRYEEMQLNFPHELENQISITAPNRAKPGEDVEITVKAQPKSNIGILAVDLGVYLLDSSYDLNKFQIIEDLRLERSYTPIPSSTYPGITSGLVTLTNAHYPFKYLHPQLPPKVYGPTILRFREKFPETWIFNNYVINETETKLTLQIPDTITTWRLTAFSNNKITGFGIVDKPTDITTIQPFFISLNLPISVKRGEIVTIPVTIFNYFNQTLETEIILYNNEKDFYFMESKVQGVEKSTDEQQKKQYIRIAAEKGKTVKFLIYPVKVGVIELRVTASSSLYTDAVLQKLKVEPDGVAKEQNQAMYLSIPAGEKISTTFTLEEPVESVPDSEYITFWAGGHYLVPTVDNFQSLTQMPTGSGEQNMVNFAPGVLILQYLKFNNKLLKEPKLVESLLSSLEIGYQQQLSFRHDNGGYSVFGVGTDDEPSTWLTAYVVRYFIKASQFLDIEPKIIDSDLEYLASQQKSNGEFPFTGYLLNPSHKNANGLTAFILLAFLEDQKYASKYGKTIETGVEFLTSNLDDVSDINALFLMATVIKRAKRHNTDSLIRQLKSHGKENNGLRWWSGNDQNLANDIEITANAALALLDTAGDHTSILKWLIEQRNANGGFISCHDTVVGLEALVKFSEKYKNVQNVNLKISYSAKDAQGNEVANDVFHVDSNNVLKLQKHELPKTTRHITFEMEGNGASLVQLNQQYNVNNVHEFHHFNIQTKRIANNDREFVLKISFTYLSDTEAPDDMTNMVIMEINLPSGFRSEAEDNLSLMKNNLVKRVETKNSETVIILYLDRLQANMNYSLEIPVDKVNEILMPKPAAIIINETETKLTLQIPDTITTWRITAFSNNKITGFGIVDKPTDITTIQPFFISLNLPISVKRGEIVTIPVTIFNYFNQTLETEIILYNNEKDFYFMESKVQGVEKSTVEQLKKQYIRIAAEKGKTVKFLINPVKVGDIELRVTASSSLYTDAVLQKLKVEPDGVAKEQNQAMYLSIPAGEKISTTFTLEEPVESVPDSEYITFWAGGHYLVPTVDNFQSLTQMPTGSGEQNMVNFAPTVLILQYLKFNNKLLKEPKLVESLLSSLEIGYQQQLSFRHDNGGYSVFGIGTDDEPSTWLTAYVVRYFIKASQFLDIEPKIIDSDLEYLASQQKSNGEFPFTGYLLNPSHKNANGLTAFILLAFLEDQKYASKYGKTIETGVEFLTSNLDDVSDINALFLIATVIKRAKRHNTDFLIRQLKSHGKENNGLRWWSGNDQNLANDIEITANAALALLDTAGDHTSILKWLIEQRNANGGFISCHDTVVGLEALVKFSEKYKNLQNVNLKISYSAKDAQGNEVANDVFHVDSNNVLKLQRHELPKTTRHITFEMEGNGASLVQLNQQYNVNNVHEFHHFNIQTKRIANNDREFVLKISFTYLSDTEAPDDMTNMVIMEINLPSGFRSEAEDNLSLMKNNLVKRVETKNSETVIILYLDRLQANMNYYLEIPVDNVNDILMPKPAAITIYDFYNLTRSNTQFYNL